MPRFKKISLGLGIALVVVIGLRRFYDYSYPYGVRTCCLPCMMSSLRAYASDHDGAFPDGTNAYDALVKLYPEYVGGTGKLLAGISGDRLKVEEAVKSGRPIDSNICSWVYFPGLHDGDNSKLVLIYDRATGVMFNGARGASGSKAVGFVDGRHMQLFSAQWTEILAAKEKLRAEAIAKRAVKK